MNYSKKGAAEAVLFSMGEPVDIARIAEALELSKPETEKVLQALQEEYEAEDRGIRLLRLENAYQLCTKTEYYDALIRIATHPVKPTLTDIMMETLAIIAYKQPVTKPEIEKIRGVKSDHAVNRLVEYGLVQELGRLDAPGRPIVFGTTDTFLRYFGLDSRENLPQMDLVKMEDFKAEVEEELQVEV